MAVASSAAFAAVPKEELDKLQLPPIRRSC